MGSPAELRGLRVFKLELAPVARSTRANICKTILKGSTRRRDHLEGSRCIGPLASLPKGMIAAKCTAKVYIEGEPCFLHTGSTVSQSFYQENLPELSIIPLENLLEVEAANGQVVPYLGNVEMKVRFPEDFLGGVVEVSTLALVIPDTSSTAQPKGLIGTNTLDLEYGKHLETNDSVCKSIP